eukprot:7376041-Prymnesium_polylepis.4
MRARRARRPPGADGGGVAPQRRIFDRDEHTLCDLARLAVRRGHTAVGAAGGGGGGAALVRLHLHLRVAPVRRVAARCELGRRSLGGLLRTARRLGDAHDRELHKLAPQRVGDVSQVLRGGRVAAR